MTGQSSITELVAAAALLAHRMTNAAKILVKLDTPEESSIEFNITDSSTISDLIRTAKAGPSPASDDYVDVVVPLRKIKDDWMIAEPIGGITRPSEATWDFVVGQIRALQDQLVGTVPLDADMDPFRGLPHSPDEELPLDEVVRQIAQKHPNRIAVVDEAVRLTYDQLVAKAQITAGQLAELGVGRGDIVLLDVPRSAHRIIGILGILMAGAAYLALSPTDPPSRRETIIRDACAAACVVAGGRAPSDALPTVDVTDERAAVSPAEPRGGSQGEPGDLAYVCYTSGTTGEPKGIAVPHRAVARLVLQTNFVDIRPDDILCHLSAISFDAATFEIFGALLNGARLVIPAQERPDLDEIHTLVDMHGATILLLPTGLLHAAVSGAPSVFARVRHVLTGGDIVSAPLVGELLEHNPGLVFTNGYGPTENTTYTTCWTTDTAPPPPTIPIGSPIRGTEVAVLDENATPVPDGVIGELYVRGVGLADGYLRRPADTAAAFLPDPWAHQPGTRMYRTGDLVRMRSDGALDYIGRRDQQVKIQGYRVEIGAVEAAIRSIDGVEDAAVLVSGTSAADRKLIGFVVDGSGEASSERAEAIRTSLRSKVASYMVPSSVRIIGAIPLTPHGKPNRDALLGDPLRARTIAEPYIAPRSPLEQQLIEIWARVLNLEMVGVKDDFFDLGGHSLLAADLIETIHREIGVVVPARVVYLQPTVEELAISIAETTGGSK